MIRSNPHFERHGPRIVPIHEQILTFDVLCVMLHTTGALFDDLVMLCGEQAFDDIQNLVQRVTRTRNPTRFTYKNQGVTVRVELLVNAEAPHRHHVRVIDRDTFNKAMRAAKADEPGQ